MLNAPVIEPDNVCAAVVVNVPTTSCKTSVVDDVVANATSPVAPLVNCVIVSPATKDLAAFKVSVTSLG